MAVLPAKKAANGKLQTGAAGARFRQRKISVKHPLAIYKQRDLPAADNNELEQSQINHLSSNPGQQLRDVHAVETGVDKNEEDEVHLQQVINAAQRALLGSSKESKRDEKESVYIPTPDASKIWPEAKKYYNDFTFKEPESYIKFSATVEDTVGVEYSMDENDVTFFEENLTKNYPKKKNEASCSELEFEILCDKLEKAIEEKQPFLSIDPSNILSYQEISSYILEEFQRSDKNNALQITQGPYVKYISTTALKERLSRELKLEPFVTLFDKNPEEQSSTIVSRPVPKLFELFGEPVYNHWKERKIERRGKSIHPSLKFEDPNANEKDNDNDPYICFRRREFRQARKTRRADTLGAERIRLLQKSMLKARDIILSVAQREVLKLKYWEAEREVFRNRAEAKTLKKAVGHKGDESLFVSHKRKIIVEDEEAIKLRRTEKRRLEARESSVSQAPPLRSNDHKERLQQQENASASSQPYVKLPPSKIPDMDLVTVSLVLKDKNETIRRAVLEKLRKRSEQDKDYINVTDDPYEPFFNILTNNNAKELSHIPYSSIAATNFHEITTSNYMNDHLKKLIKDGKLLPGMKTFRGANGELIPSKPFPHLLSLLRDHVENRKNDSNGYVAQLLHNIETNNFSAYSQGYGGQERDEQKENLEVSEPVFRLRKRIGRGSLAYIDRQGIIRRPERMDDLEEYLKFDDDEEVVSKEESVFSSDSRSDEMEVDDALSRNIKNVYDCEEDKFKRLNSRWKFDDDLSEYERGIESPFSLDPSKLNCISSSTQSIRFGSMLLAKSYDLYRDSVHHRQQVLIQQARMRALQLQQLANKQNNQQQQNQVQIQGAQRSSQQGLTESGSNSSTYTASDKLRSASSSSLNLSRSGTSSSGGPKANTNSQPRTTNSSPLLASQVTSTDQNSLPKGNVNSLLYNGKISNNINKSNSSTSTSSRIDTGKSTK